MKRTLSIIAAIGLLAVLASGCSQDGNPSSNGTAAVDDYARIDLDQEFGGLTATDEEAAFADAGMSAVLAADVQETSDDPQAQSPDVIRLDRMGRDPSVDPDSLRPHLTFVKLRWGHLDGPVDSLDAADGCARTDWSGTVRVDRGLLVVRRLLAFERPYDHLVMPRLDARTVALVSHTGCGHDGLVLQILERPATPGAAPDPAPNRLHLDLGPYTASFDVTELATTDTVTEVDAAGNSFAVTGLRPGRADLCPSGFLSGRYRPWPTDRPDSSTAGAQVRVGQFVGVWRTLDGRVGGFLRGAYGVNGDGERVLVGKYISPRGRFRGLIRGTWEPGAVAGDLGHFTGHWYGAAGNAEGVLGGDGHPVPGARGGWFAGRWAALCDDEAAGSVN